MCFVFWVLGVTFILDVGKVTVSVSFVFDDFNAAVWESSSINFADGITVAHLLSFVIVVRRLVLNGVVELVG